MKPKLFLLAGLLVFAGFAFGQKETRQQKVAAVEAKVKKAVESGRYELNIDKANPMGGHTIHLTSEYTLRMSNDSAYSYLPYFGRAYSAPMNGEGGIKFSEKTTEKAVVFKDKKGYTINFKVRGADDTYRFLVTIWLNGSVSINVTSNNRQTIDFSGNLLLPDK